MKESQHVTTALRIKVLDTPIIVHRPGANTERTVLRFSEGWVSAQNHPTLLGWIILPDHNGHGLPLQQWMTLWDDLRVEIEAQNADGSWSNLFQ